VAEPKTPLTIVAQVELLMQRGLVAPGTDDKIALGRLLADNGFSRLEAYWRHFQIDPSHGDKSFLPGTTVDGIANLYAFDSTLRRLLAEGLEVFEIALRSRLAQEMAMAGALYTYDEQATYRHQMMGPGRRVDARTDLLDNIDRDLGRSREPFITRYLDQSQTAPLWLAMEAFTLGTVSKVYRLLDDQDVRLKVARSFGYPNERFAENTFHSLSVLRNICAHHARIWHRADIQYAPPVLKRLQADADRSVYQRTPWAWVTSVTHLVDTIKHDTSFSTRMLAHVQAHAEYVDGLKHPSGI
jgi:abortive infection bacteriophage resistance protein